MKFLRICWGPQRTNTFNVNWDAINAQSYVVVTASEGGEDVEDGQVLLSTSSPKRFVGDARFTVCNIAPQPHKLSFHVVIDFDHPLVLWTDIILFDGIKDIMRVSDRGSLEIDIQE